MSRTVDEWIAAAPASQQAQLQQLRAIIMSVAPDAIEALKWGQPCYARNALFCYLQYAKTHVTLGFQKGALMPDPHQRLSGDGKQMRHIRFKTGEAIDREFCVAVIVEALKLD